MGKGDDFEKVVENIYLLLSKKERINAEIRTKVKMVGDDGATHEIDVLYSFEHFGIFYQVGIECKNWRKKINVSELRNFDYKLKHIGGIMVYLFLQKVNFKKELVRYQNTMELN